MFVIVVGTVQAAPRVLHHTIRKPFLDGNCRIRVSFSHQSRTNVDREKRNDFHFGGFHSPMLAGRMQNVNNFGM